MRVTKLKATMAIKANKKKKVAFFGRMVSRETALMELESMPNRDYELSTLTGGEVFIGNL